MCELNLYWIAAVRQKTISIFIYWRFFLCVCFRNVYLDLFPIYLIAHCAVIVGCGFCFASLIGVPQTMPVKVGSNGCIDYRVWCVVLGKTIHRLGTSIFTFFLLNIQFATSVQCTLHMQVHSWQFLQRRAIYGNFNFANTIDVELVFVPNNKSQKNVFAFFFSSENSGGAFSSDTNFLYAFCILIRGMEICGVDMRYNGIGWSNALRPNNWSIFRMTEKPRNIIINCYSTM